jgi:hypothetical protein
VKIRSVVRAVVAAYPRETVAVAVALEFRGLKPCGQRGCRVRIRDSGGHCGIRRTDRVAGADLASAFGNAYALAMQSLGGAPGSGKTAPATPPPPPITVPYEGQMLE